MKTLITTILGTTLLATSLFSANITAEEIIKKVDSRDDGSSMKSTMEMILIDKHNNTRSRTIKLLSKDVGEDEEKIMFFESPADVKNTAFLTYDYDDGAKDDDQWLYLPALKKVKRIPSTDKSSSFMGSDFTYSDMTQRDIKEYSYKLVKELDDRGHKAWLIQSTPKTQKTIDETGYVKSLLIIRQENYVLSRAVHTMAQKGYYKFYDAKTIEKIDGIWQATEMLMSTKNGKKVTHSTILKHSNISFNEKIDDTIFTTRTLERGL